ncbi:hypothetical protein IMZ31_19130 (plasmid) [Pontibacillus sp. ALD_SL1]|uniref:DUF7659 family protein n=1 Tax=Pontibacillus sp. ALD_SL1 TaxID=2777185 RepID=UPI001A97C4F8|nr:hypothetical protein [Pontibacillus sp. ALD_SL1]QST02664.1 hypothetical protein IMZ31_19130 [Pontibacillus sp. ALD_SL1]
MTITYEGLKRKQEKEMNDFPMVFAFSKQQFEEGMKKLGLSPEDADQVASFGYNGFMRKSDKESFSELLRRHDMEMKEAMDEDSTGEGFIFEMFDYELWNHEYGYTGELGRQAGILGISMPR